MKIIFVCSGNTCRSPMAEGILKSLLESDHSEVAGSIEILSAGTGSSCGASASDNSIAVCLTAGIDISAHQSRPATPDLIANADLVLTMEEHHCRALFYETPDPAGMITTLANFAGDSDVGGVSDPFGGSLEDYQATFDKINDLIKKALPILLTRRS